MIRAGIHPVFIPSAKFHLKSAGYLAAALSFGQDADVLMLATNLIKVSPAQNAN
jgi:AP-3 complex subunit delta